MKVAAPERCGTARQTRLRLGPRHRYPTTAVTGRQRHDCPVLERTQRDLHPVLSWLTVAAIAGTVLLRSVGVPSVDLHGPLHRVGVMDPLCGGTRATFLFASGRYAAAAEYNPVVFPLAFALAVMTLRLLSGVAAGRWYQLKVPRWARWPLFGVFGLALVALGIRQQMHAALLIQPWAGP